MQKISTLLLLLAITYTTQAQMPSCCAAASAPEQFAALGTDASFVSKHEDPLPINFIPENGKMVVYDCPDGRNANAYAIKANEKTDNYIFIFHEWWGLNDHIKKMAEKIYSDLGGRVNILALDLYDGKVANTSDSASAYMQGLDQNRAKSIITGAINRAGANAHIATIGWCMGGGYSLQGSIAMAGRGVGCIMYYGMPETDINKLKQLNGDVLMIWANEDQWINKDKVAQFKKDMTAAGKQLRVEEYTADHAFANPSNPKFNKEAAEDAYGKSLAFLKRVFGME